MIKWNPCDSTMAWQLSGITSIPGQVYPFPMSALPESIQVSMPGVKETYVSGYLNPTATDFATISGYGELAIIRDDDNLTKSYNYVFALDDQGRFYFAGPFKDFPEHHIQKGNPVPIEKIFGHTPIS